MKKIILIAFFLLSAVNTISSADKNALTVPASAILLKDLTTGKIIYARNKDMPLSIASLTKIMTAILIIEKTDLDTLVKISRNVRKINTWKLGLRWGQKIRMRDLLYTILMESRNDAALAAAEAIGGSERNFVDLMNKKAKSIGAVNTKFTNSHGLDIDGGNFSTASDLVKITQYAMKKNLFTHIVSTKEKDICWKGGKTHHKKLKNVNKMLFLYAGVDGVKTGYTRMAGKCIITTCTRNGHRILCIILNTDNLWKNTTQMLNYGFSCSN
jgi:serine-type D-Ala-D-Ala carboxypeptidase (penicillin-binding protein 5/6)